MKTTPEQRARWRVDRNNLWAYEVAALLDDIDELQGLLREVLACGVSLELSSYKEMQISNGLLDAIKEAVK